MDSSPMSMPAFKLAAVLGLGMLIAVSIYTAVIEYRLTCVRRYQATAEAVAAGTLRPDTDGRVPSGSDANPVFARWLPDGRVLVLFGAHPTHGNNFDGFMFASGPLTSDDLGSHLLRVGVMDDVQVDHYVGNWYQASRRVD